MMDDTKAVINQAYTDFCKRVEKECYDSNVFGAVIVRVPQDQVGVIVTLQSRYWWDDGSDMNKKVARVKHYTINGQIIAAAVFKDVSSGTHAIWIEPKKAILTTLCAGEAIVVDFSLSNIAYEHSKEEDKRSKRETNDAIGRTLCIAGLFFVVLAIFVAFVGGSFVGAIFMLFLAFVCIVAGCLI